MKAWGLSATELNAPLKVLVCNLALVLHVQPQMLAQLSYYTFTVIKCQSAGPLPGLWHICWLARIQS